MRKLFLTMISMLFTSSICANNKAEYLCKSAKVNYEKCRRDRDNDCIKTNKLIYEKKLNCSKVLGGLKINQTNTDFQSDKFKWTNDCQNLVRDHRRCGRAGDRGCASKLKQKHSQLKCASGLRIYLDTQF